MAQRRHPLADAGEHQLGPLAITDVGGMDDGTHQEPERIDQQMAFASVQLLGPIVATRPPFSVVRTD